jgi:hypothetical protein
VYYYTKKAKKSAGKTGANKKEMGKSKRAERIGG